MYFLGCFCHIYVSIVDAPWWWWCFLSHPWIPKGLWMAAWAKVRLSPQSAAATGVSLSIREPCHLYNMSGRVHVKIYSRRNVFATISNTGISILYKKNYFSAWKMIKLGRSWGLLRLGERLIDKHSALSPPGKIAGRGISSLTGGKCLIHIWGFSRSPEEFVVNCNINVGGARLYRWNFDWF